MLSSIHYDGIECDNVATASESICCPACNMMELCVIMWQRYQRWYVV